MLQDNHDFLTRCIKEDLGFKNGKPVAASIIYKCLLHWHAFESERTAIFDYIIDGINNVLKVSDLLLFLYSRLCFLFMLLVFYLEMSYDILLAYNFITVLNVSCRMLM